MIKNLILVVIGGVIIGLGIFFGEKALKGNSDIAVVRHQKNVAESEYSSTPVPTSKPTPEPLNESSNLGEEINKLTPPDFSEDFKELKDQVSE
jgi:hypothetical protein